MLCKFIRVRYYLLEGAYCKFFQFLGTCLQEIGKFIGAPSCTYFLIRQWLCTWLYWLASLGGYVESLVQVLKVVKEVGSKVRLN